MNRKTVQSIGCHEPSLAFVEYYNGTSGWHEAIASALANYTANQNALTVALA